MTHEMPSCGEEHCVVYWTTDSYPQARLTDAPNARRHEDRDRLLLVVCASSSIVAMGIGRAGITTTVAIFSLLPEWLLQWLGRHDADPGGKPTTLTAVDKAPICRLHMPRPRNTVDGLPAVLISTAGAQTMLAVDGALLLATDYGSGPTLICDETRCSL